MIDNPQIQALIDFAKADPDTVIVDCEYEPFFDKYGITWWVRVGQRCVQGKQWVSRQILTKEMMPFIIQEAKDAAWAIKR